MVRDKAPYIHSLTSSFIVRWLCHFARARFQAVEKFTNVPRTICTEIHFACGGSGGDESMKFNDNDKKKMGFFLCCRFVIVPILIYVSIPLECFRWEEFFFFVCSPFVNLLCHIICIKTESFILHIRIYYTTQEKATYRVWNVWPPVNHRHKKSKITENVNCNIGSGTIKT